MAVTVYFCIFFSVDPFSYKDKDHYLQLVIYFLLVLFFPTKKDLKMSRILSRQLNTIERRFLSNISTKRTLTQLPRMSANQRLTQTKNFLSPNTNYAMKKVILFFSREKRARN